MHNPMSYCGLVDTRISASEKDLPVPQMFQNLSVQFVCSSPKNLDFIEKRLHWASIVRVQIAE